MSRTSQTILLFEVTPISPHIQTTLEIGFRHENLGDTVLFCPIYRHVPYLEFGNRDFLIQNKEKISLNGYYQSILGSENYWGVEIPDRIHFEFNNARLDSGIISTLKWATRCNNLQEILQKKGDFVAQVQQGAQIAEAYAEFCIKKVNPDLCYVYNGRFAVSYAIHGVCQRYHIPCLFHERGSDINRFEIFDKFIQSFKNYHNRIYSLTNGLSSMIIDYEAHKFYIEKRGVNPTDWPSFLPKIRETPFLKDLGNDFLVFFTSADFEMGAFIESTDAGMGDQLESLKQLCTACKFHKKRLIVRFHPNSRDSVDNLPMYELLDSMEVLYFKPDSHIDSYALMDAAEKVFTFGSTIGIEASYWGKPSFSLARYIGQTAAPTSVIDSSKKLHHAISAPAEKDMASYIFALHYGCYMARFGTTFEFFKFNDFFSIPTYLANRN